jgi:D-methionine transport system permease protein
LIGYSAMAGAVGGGGLGELAINYGYQRFNVWVMLETIIILVVIVQWVQSVGDLLAEKRKLKGLSIGSVIFLAVCITVQAWPSSVSTLDTLRVGIMSGAQQKIMAVAKRVAWQKYHLHLNLVVFNDYVQPNIALNNGDIDANIFQHVPYLDSQIKSRGFKVSPIAKTFVYPMGFYSRKIHKLSQLKDGAIVAIPNDPSNEGRALLVLQKAHLITLNPKAGLFATTKSITHNPKHLKFKELGDAQLPRVLKDATLVALTNDYVGPAGFSVKQAILREGADSPYANVIVVRTKNKNNPLFKQLIAAMHSKPVVNATMSAFPNGAAIAAWSTKP